MQIEKDMDRLEEKIKISEKAVHQLKGGVSKLDDQTAHDVGTSPRETFQSLVFVDRENDDGCKFSKTPSGLSSDVKVSHII